MKIRIFMLSLLIASIFAAGSLKAEEQTRNVSSFSAISLRIPGKLYLKQGSPQSIKIEAKESVLEDIITEVNGDKLIIRFPNKTIFERNFNPGKIEIYVTVPDVNELGISGSGDILADELEARILDLAISGSGNINIDNLDSKKVKASISGSGNINIEDGGIAEEFGVSISGSGNCNASGFEADDVTVNTSGSGNCKVKSNGSVKARIAGSGNVFYDGNASIDATVAGSGKVKKM